MKAIKFDVTIERKEDCYRAILVDEGNHIAIQSRNCDMLSKDDRRAALNEFLDNITYVISQKAFPEDTMIYEAINDENGIRMVVKGYPDEIESGEDIGKKLP